ncbi:MAG TPA: YkvA family protein [Candidatus Kapabacteria bacterium]|nr:YkvA family protein [Candidatus Kapabacteria bacterium]
MSKLVNYKEHQKHYSDASFFKKINNVAKKIGKRLIHKALLLYYVAMDNDTPVWTKSLIFGVLGYFILPLDVIPDIAPFVGFSDDLAAIVSTISIIWNNIKPEHLVHVDKMMIRIFGTTIKE